MKGAKADRVGVLSTQVRPDQEQEPHSETPEQKAGNTAAERLSK